MKKLLTLTTLFVFMIVSSCTYDDTGVWNSINNLEQRVFELEKMCKDINSNITAMQTIVSAIQNNDYITSVTPVEEDGKVVGYTITFVKASPITIYNGKDGADGADGQDGVDGYTPNIGIDMDTDGIYYWTLDGEWLLDDNGQKIKAVGVDGTNGTDGENGKDGADGEDGKDGADGTDGITPVLKIENDYWYISYDNGATWTKLGKATGEAGADGADGADGTNGKDGKDGDSFFQSVDTSDDEYVIFTLADGTVIKIPTWYAFEELKKQCEQMNSNIEAMQAILVALQNNDYVTSVTQVVENGKTIGYTINFTKSPSVTIYHGVDGKDGANGKDGYTPVIGVRMDADGVYYWTLDGEWLTDDGGNKIKAVGLDGEDGKDGENGKDGADGEDGKDGENGKDGADGEDGKDGENGKDGADGKDGENGITPELKIEDGYWYISYDNGATWTQLGKATGENGADGKDGKDGDSFFSTVTFDNKYVYLTLSDGTEITVPMTSNSPLADLDSVVFVPRYNDGKATLTRYEGDGVVVAEFDFMITPASVSTIIADNYASMLTISAVQTETRATTLISMPVISCSADNKGIITVKASGKYLNSKVFEGSINYSAVLTISDGINSATSEYVELYAGVSEDSSDKVEEPIIPDNPVDPETPELPDDGKIIYYTTSDSAPVELAASTGFGGILLSNEYDTEANIGKLTFSATVTCIPANAFKESTIRTITIPDTVTEIGNEAFYNSKINEITIGENVKVLGRNIFWGCDSLNYVDINCSCDISVQCFAYCTSLRTVIIGNNVTSIGKCAFENCYYLSKLTIGNSVEGIYSEAFYSCDQLETIVIPDSTTTIGAGAFGSCDNLTSITFGSGLESVGQNAFQNCGKLEYLHINDIASYCSVDYYNLWSTPKYYNKCNIYLNGNLLEELVIPEGVTKIGSCAFYNCDALKSVTIPNTVKTISEYAFGHCENITEIYVPGVNNSDYTTSIEGSAFENCTKLSQVVIGERVSSIGAKAFYNCSILQKFYSKATTPPSLGTNVFYGSNGYTIGTEIYVPAEATETYKGATGWRDYSNYIKGYNF